MYDRVCASALPKVGALVPLLLFPTQNWDLSGELKRWDFSSQLGEGRKELSR
jgi:hypothetical protein